MASPSEVPSKYDVAFTVGGVTTGYTFLRTLDGSYLSANRHRAEYTSTATFVERTNVSGAYGDDSQSFWLTFSQNDWSLGEKQRFYRPNGAAGDDSKRQFWTGSYVDRSIQGQVKANYDTVTATPAGAVTALAACAASALVERYYFLGSDSHLYRVSGAGVITDQGAHGAGTISGANAFLADTEYVYIGGGTKIRKWLISAPAFTDFATPSGQPYALTYLNNSLYGVVGPSLVVYSSAGVETVLFTWKTGAGTNWTVSDVTMVAYGSKLLIARGWGIAGGGGELWIYDGTGTTKVAEFANNFAAESLAVAEGVAYIGGYFTVGTDTYEPAVYYWANGTLGLTYRANATVTGAYAPASVAAFQGGLIIADIANGKFMFRDSAQGGITSFAAHSTAGALSTTSARVGAGGRGFIYVKGTNSVWVWPSTSISSTATVTTSLYDFDSSLDKQFRGIKVDFDLATDGNGGSVDIAYRVGDVDGSFTTLQTGAVSGTQYPLTGVSGRSLSVKVTLNRGTSTSGPVLKRIYVRAAPVLQSYKVRTYNLDLSSMLDHPTRLEDGTDQPIDGFTQAQNLMTAITSTSPITITDKFGTFTGVCEPSQCSILELHSKGSTSAVPGQYIAQVMVREV